jgi:hypothetical protein
MMNTKSFCPCKYTTRNNNSDEIFRQGTAVFSQSVIPSRYKYRVRSPKFIWAPLHSCTHWLRLPPRIWAHIRGRYWSAKIDDSLCNPLVIPVSFGVGWRVWGQWRPFEARLPFVVGVGENLNPPRPSLGEARFREVNLRSNL